MALRLVGLVRERGEEILRREHRNVRWRGRRRRGIIVVLDHGRYGRRRSVVQNGRRRLGHGPYDGRRAGRRRLLVVVVVVLVVHGSVLWKQNHNVKNGRWGRNFFFE